MNVSAALQQINDALQGRHETDDKPPIVTSFVYPPIPTRDFDWCAYRDGWEERGGYGWGRTEEEAIADLLANEEDEE